MTGYLLVRDEEKIFNGIKSDIEVGRVRSDLGMPKLAADRVSEYLESQGSYANVDRKLRRRKGSHDGSDDREGSTSTERPMAQEVRGGGKENEQNACTRPMLSCDDPS
jgi:hypothetical protein